MRWIFGVVVLSSACASPEKSDETAQTTVAAAPATVTLEQFKEIHSWLQGVWHGSGGNYPSFFEEYRVLDDSTVRMRAFSDSTRSAVTDSSTIELRAGNVRSVRPGSHYDVIAIAADSIRFLKPGTTAGGHTFRKVSPDEWTATLHPGQPAGQATVYVMRRIAP